MPTGPILNRVCTLSRLITAREVHEEATDVPDTYSYRGAARFRVIVTVIIVRAAVSVRRNSSEKNVRAPGNGRFRPCLIISRRFRRLRLSRPKLFVSSVLYGS